MSDNQPYLLALIVSAILSGVGGYLTRRVQKYDDSRDEAHLKILPALSYLMLSFIKSIDIYRQLQNFKAFKLKVDDIASALGIRISSGEALLAKIDFDRLLAFYWNLQHLQVQLAEIEDNEDRQQNLLRAFDEGSVKYSAWLKVDPKNMIEEAKKINQEIDSKIRGYKSISFWVIILIIIIAIIIGTTNFLDQLIQPQVPLSLDNVTTSN